MKRIMCGRLCMNPQMWYSEVCRPSATFRLAIKGLPNEFIDCIAYDGLAKVIMEYCVKGRLISVEGEIKNKRLIIENMQMLYDGEFIPEDSPPAITFRDIEADKIEEVD